MINNWNSLSTQLVEEQEFPTVVIIFSTIYFKIGEAQPMLPSFPYQHKTRLLFVLFLQQKLFLFELSSKKDIFHVKNINIFLLKVRVKNWFLNLNTKFQCFCCMIFSYLLLYLGIKVSGSCQMRLSSCCSVKLRLLLGPQRVFFIWLDNQIYNVIMCICDLKSVTQKKQNLSRSG